MTEIIDWLPFRYFRYDCCISKNKCETNKCEKACWEIKVISKNCHLASSAINVKVWVFWKSHLILNCNYFYVYSIPLLSNLVGIRFQNLHNDLASCIMNGDKLEVDSLWYRPLFWRCMTDTACSSLPSSLGRRTPVWGPRQIVGHSALWIPRCLP